MADLLKQGLEKLNFSQTEIDSLIIKMEQYIKELVLFNSAYNLVNTDNHDEIVVRHILDSLAAAGEIKKLADAQKAKGKTKVVIGDIGSGGGLPGIPLASALPDIEFVLVERMSKRCAFLENAAAILGLKNVSMLNKEAEKVKKESIDIAVFRAFRPLDKTMIKTLLDLIPSDGVLAAYKAKKEKIIEEMSAIGYEEKDYDLKKLEVPFLTDTSSDESRERNLVIVSKSLA
ncbi:MAG: 16S rRNA (guanine(527)-N(7))-methyltransferase RsmG [Treponema sp.]|nr:16S rRNA (guanine(527)-N(7))-methyltransferase RsmG [Treponema sp.]